MDFAYLTSMTLVDLKAAAYDALTDMESAQIVLRNINNEIARRHMPEYQEGTIDTENHVVL